MALKGGPNLQPPATEINTFVFFDVESSGLHGTRPRITEMSFVALHRKALLEINRGHLRRVIDKLTLCVYPLKPIPPGVTDVSGLDNDNLQYKKPFNAALVDSINLFLQRQCPPTCLVAHNGKGFDFGILQNELQSIGKTLLDGVLCIDSLDYFRSCDGMPPLYLWPPVCAILEHENDPPGSSKKDVESRTSEQMENQTQCTADESSTGIGGKAKASTSLPRYYTPDKTLKKGLAKFHKNRGVKRQLFSADDLSNVANEEEESTDGSEENHEGSISLLNGHALDSQTPFAQVCSCKRSRTIDKGCQTIDDKASSFIPPSSMPVTDSQGSASQTQAISQSSSSTSSYYSTCPFSPSGSSVYSIDSDLEEEIKAESSQGSSFYGNDEATLEVLAEEASQALPPVSPSVLEWSTSTHWLLAGDDDLGDSEILAAGICADEELEASGQASKLANPGNEYVNSKIQDTNKVAATPDTKSKSAVYENEMFTPKTSPPPAVSGFGGSKTPTRHGLLKNPEANKAGRSPFSHRQRDIHFRIFGEFPPQEHRAEDDCLSLARIFNCKAPEILQWCDRNAVSFRNIYPLYSVKPRGISGDNLDGFPGLCD